MTIRRTRTARRHRRRGTILVLSAVLLAIVIAVAAFAIDIGYLLIARSELQRAADAAAMAAAWELIDEDELTGPTGAVSLESDARAAAAQYARLNLVLRQQANVADEDIQIGRLAFNDSDAEMQLVGYIRPNAARVVVSRSSSTNGRVPFFLASILGIDSAAAEAESTAALLTNISGFRPPAGGGNLDFLPFALDLQSWTALLNGVGTDEWKWNAELGKVQPGTDGILELNLYPQGTGSPGNRGTVDIGSNNNSTADIARQIVHGVSPEDLSYHGGKLQFDAQGKLVLNGDTGISAGVKDELESIKGLPRIVPIFSTVTGPGNNAQYTIVQFAGVRVMNVKLTGPMSGKKVMIQPAQIVSKGAIPADDGAITSRFIYSPAWIVR